MITTVGTFALDETTGSRLVLGDALGLSGVSSLVLGPRDCPPGPVAVSWRVIVTGGRGVSEFGGLGITACAYVRDVPSDAPPGIVGWGSCCGCCWLGLGFFVRRGGTEPAERESTLRLRLRSWAFVSRLSAKSWWRAGRRSTELVEGGMRGGWVVPSLVILL